MTYRPVQIGDVTYEIDTIPLTAVAEQTRVVVFAYGGHAVKTVTRVIGKPYTEPALDGRMRPWRLKVELEDFGEFVLSNPAIIVRKELPT
jgi:hypothetical protein